MERTFCMIKPDGVQRGLCGDLINRFERKGLKIVGMKLLHISKDQGERHYAEHVDKEFFVDLVAFITSGPVLAMVLEGENAIQTVRTMMGKTNPLEAAPGSIRGDYALTMRKNVVHGSDAPESAAREIANFFSEEELVDYIKSDAEWTC